MTEGDYRIVFQNLPIKIKCFVAVDESGFPTIYANAKYSLEALQRSLSHEIKHLDREDVYSTKSATEVEYEAHA